MFENYLEKKYNETPDLHFFKSEIINDRKGQDLLKLYNEIGFYFLLLYFNDEVIIYE